MAERPTRRVFERNTELASAADIKRRLFYVSVIVAVPVGVIVLIRGLATDRATIAVIGGALVVVALVGGWLGRSLIAKTKAELSQNPFKSPRVPKE